MTPEEYEKEALQRPDSWADFDEEKRRFRTFAPTVAQTNRDADALTTSNYETIKADLYARFPESDLMTASDGHWAVGWVEGVFIRVRDEQTGEYTPAFLAAVDWYNQMQSYPVADEDDLSQRESDELESVLKDSYSVPEDMLGAVRRYLWDEHDVSRYEDISNDRYVFEALREAGMDVDDMPSWLSRYADEEPEPEKEREYRPGAANIKMATMDPRTGQIVNEKLVDANLCPHLIMIADHYNDDGPCKCYDESAVEMITYGYRWKDGMWR